MKILVTGMGSVLSAEKLEKIKQTLAENEITDYEIITDEKELVFNERFIPLECLKIERTPDPEAINTVSFMANNPNFNSRFKFNNVKKISK